MKESMVVLRENNLKSRNSNNGNEIGSLNSGEINVTNPNNYTFKQNSNSFQKHVKNSNYLRLKNEDTNSKLYNKSFGHINIPKLSDQLKSSTEKTLKKTINTNENINYDKKLLLNRIKNQHKIFNYTSLSKTEINTNTNKTKNSFQKKNTFKEINETLIKHYRNDFKTNELFSYGKINPSEKNDLTRKQLNSSEKLNIKLQIKKSKEQFDHVLDPKNNSLYSEKTQLLKKILEGLSHENAHKNVSNDKNILERQKYLFLSVSNIENKIDSIIKDNESLKELIGTKLECFEQMKNQLDNLTFMIENLFKKNNYFNEKPLNNFTSAIKRHSKLSKKNVEISSKKMYSLNSNESDLRNLEEDKKMNKNCEALDNSSISICSEFSIENSRELSNPRKITNRSLKKKATQEVEKRVISEVFETSSDLGQISEKNSNKDNIIERDTYCFVNQLDITKKNNAKRESNLQIINFENNSFKKDSIGFSLTVKDPNVSQSNLNSISTKTNTKSQQDFTWKLSHDTNFRIGSNSNPRKKEC